MNPWLRCVNDFCGTDNSSFELWYKLCYFGETLLHEASRTAQRWQSNEKNHEEGSGTNSQRHFCRTCGKKDKKCTQKRNTKFIREITVTVVMQNYIFCVCVCVFSLVVQHAKRMRHVILSYVACVALPYFSTLAHKRPD